jgi:proline dehydrogenase
MVSFDNTRIAFARMDQLALRRARLLFGVMGMKGLVLAANRILPALIRAGLPVGWLVKPTIYKHFVGGETLGGCAGLVDSLAGYGVKSILDYSVEGIGSEEAIAATLKETLASVQNAGENPNIPFAVFKPSAFIRHEVLNRITRPDSLSSEDVKETEAFRKRVEILCEEAACCGIPLLIDAEDSWYQWLIDEVTEEMMSRYNREQAIVFNTLQMYRHDRFDYLRQLIGRARQKGFIAGLKFVRGAYMEKERLRAASMGYPSPIQPDKAATDRDFDAALAISVENLDTVSIFCGTHNEESCRFLIDQMDKQHIPANHPRVWFSQLYGMSDHISFNLAREGYNVAKYVPYGPVKHVMPYLMRRAEENTSVAGQTGRELRLLAEEWQRRKQAKRKV